MTVGWVEEAVEVVPGPGLGAVGPDEIESADVIVGFDRGAFLAVFCRFVAINLPIDDVGAAPVQGGIDGGGDGLLDLFGGEIVFRHSEFTEIDVAIAEIGAVGHICGDEIECFSEYVGVLVLVGRRIPGGIRDEVQVGVGEDGVDQAGPALLHRGDDAIDFGGVIDADAVLTELPLSLVYAGLAGIQPVYHAFYCSGSRVDFSVEPGADQPVAFPVLEDKCLAGPLIGRQKMLGQFVELSLLVGLLLGREAVSEIAFILPHRKAHEDKRLEGLVEEVSEVRRLCDFDHVLAFGPLRVEAVGIPGLMKPYLNDPRAEGEDLIGAFAEEVLIGEVIKPVDVRDADDIAQLLGGMLFGAEISRTSGVETTSTDCCEQNSITALVHIHPAGGVNSKSSITAASSAWGIL